MPVDYPYDTPPWAVNPQLSVSWSLTEIKNGVSVAQHALQRPLTVLGRAADAVDIPVQHESCSRWHARLAFDKDGTLWLKDLSSTHGTTVNKRKLPPQACGKEESASSKAGARGVVVYPGDLLQFGASTRLFCVEGPADVVRRPKGVPTPATTQQQNDVAIDPKESEVDDDDDKKGSLVSWGMDMEDHVEATETPRFELQEDEIPGTHRREFEQIKALRYKLANIQQESDRIRRKSDLTEGQEKQLRRNDEREKEIGHRLEEREAELYRKLNPESAPARSTPQHTLVREDEVDDRTQNLLDDDYALDEKGETEESLREKWHTMRSKRLQVLKERNVVQEKIAKLKDRVQKLQAAGDDEAFFLQNDVDMATEQVKGLADMLERLDVHLSETEKLLRIANPRLIVIDLDTGHIGQHLPQKMPPPPQIVSKVAPSGASDGANKMLPPPLIRPAVSSIGETAANDMLPPPSIQKQPLVSSVEVSESNNMLSPPSLQPQHAVSSAGDPGESTILPSPLMQTQPAGCLAGETGANSMFSPPSMQIDPTKSDPVQAVTTHAPGHPNSKNSHETNHSSRGQKRQRVVGPSKPKALDQTNDLTGKQSVPSRRSTVGLLFQGANGRACPNQVSEQEEQQVPSSLNQKVDAWQPPKDQDGSGRTKLNDKFAGRY